MFSKLASFVVLVAVATAAPQHQQPAAQFPAGVNPALCPGFPICDNAYLHNPQPGAQPHAPQWNPAPAAPAHNQWNPAPAHNQWNAAPAHNQWNAAPAHNQWNAPATAAPHWATPAPYSPPSNHLDATGGDKFPAGVNPQSCPNYPYCDTSAGVGGHAAAPQVAPLPGYTERQYPAGVSPHQCPNFPYCS